MPKQHVLDIVAEDLAGWIDHTADQLADAMTEGGVTPFAAQTTSADRLAYYRTRFFNPDGSPNQQGRDEEEARLGTEGFLKALRTVIDAGAPSGGTVPTGVPGVREVVPGSTRSSRLEPTHVPGVSEVVG